MNADGCTIPGPTIEAAPPINSVRPQGQSREQVLLARIAWMQDRLQDIAEDADDVSYEVYGEAALDHGGKIGGIKAVAENEQYACSVTLIERGLQPRPLVTREKMFDVLRRESLSAEAQAIVAALEPFVYAAENFACAHIATDKIDADDNADEEHALIADEDYNATKRALVDAYGLLASMLPGEAV